jgi:hypothetical protein
MRGNFVTLLAFVQLHYFFSVNWKSMIRVNNDAKKARICVNKARVISLFDVVKNRCLIKASKISHVLLFVKFWRIHLLDIVFGH